MSRSVQRYFAAWWLAATIGLAGVACIGCGSNRKTTTGDGGGLVSSDDAGTNDGGVAEAGAGAGEGGASVTDADASIGCSAPGQANCVCYSGQAQPNDQACNPSLFDSGLCCASAGWPTGTGTCQCQAWGCTASTGSATASCQCVWGTPLAAPACEPATGAVCCADGEQCSCGAMTACSAPYVQVARCDVTHATCGGVQYPMTVPACH